MMEGRVKHHGFSRGHVHALGVATSNAKYTSPRTYLHSRLEIEKKKRINNHFAAGQLNVSAAVPASINLCGPHTVCVHDTPRTHILIGRVASLYIYVREQRRIHTHLYGVHNIYITYIRVYYMHIPYVRDAVGHCVC